jgi:hypothetical protein
LQSAIPPPQCTINLLQTTIKKPTNPPSQQNPLNQNQEQTKTNKSKPTNHHNQEQHQFLAHEHIGEVEATPVLVTQPLWFKPSLFLSPNFDSESYISELRTFVPFDMLRSELESHHAALNHELIDLINCLVGSGSGAASIA